MKILVDGQTLGTPELQRGIGKVFLEILYHMVDGDVRHDWLIAVRDQAHFDLLKPRLRRWMKPVILPSLAASGAQIEWCRAYGRQLDEVARGVGAEVYWNPNPLMPNVHYPLGFSHCNIVVTLHDLIPRLMPERFKHLLGDALWSDYSGRCDAMAARNTWVIGVSEASAKDFLAFYPENKTRVGFAHHASNYSLFWPYVQGDRFSNPSYVLYVGGFDPRKNMDNALRAFAAFAKNRGQEEIRFKVICAHDQASRDGYFALARELGVEDRLDLPGYVEDEELGYLFRGASVFFFPSLYEGFGLPVLDALACGVPVAASGTSSIPEVGGEHVIYCDPTDIADMAHALGEAWKQRDPNAPRRTAAVTHARSFRWEKTARHYLSTFEEVTIARQQGKKTQRPRKPRVAYLSPWLPQKTGVANYSYHLMPELLARMNVTLFAESSKDCLPKAGLNIQSIDDYPNQAAEFDGAIYHLGNGLTHLKIYEHAWRFPGVIVLHDFNIHPFFHHGFLGQPWEPLYEEALKEYGPAGWAAWEQYRSTGRRPDLWQFPMSHPIARRSRVTVVHSRWVAEQMGEAGKVLSVHLGAQPQPDVSEEERQRLRQQLTMDDACFWVGVFGFVNRHKRVDSIMKAVGNLYRRGYPVRLLIVGEVNDSRVDLPTLAEQYGVANIFRYEGYVAPDQFLEYMKAVDVVANLRYPTMGESSGTMFHALALGKAILVSDSGSFSEIPDSVVWKADPQCDEIDQLVLSIEVLLKAAAVRNSLSANGRRFVSGKASFERVAETYLRAATVR